MSAPTPAITFLCRDLMRHVFDLHGYEFMEQEVAYYKHRAVAHIPLPAAPLPVLPPPPAPAPAPVPAPAPAASLFAPTLVKHEEVVIIDPIPYVIEAVAQPLPPAPENRVIEIAAPIVQATTTAAATVERVRYKRTELPDEVRCTANTSRGTRCTLEREAGKTVCSRHPST